MSLPVDPEASLSKRQAAEFLGVSERSIDNYRRHGWLAANVLAPRGGRGRVTFTRAQLNDFRSRFATNR